MSGTGTPGRRWVLASNNAGKLKEFAALFQTLDIEVVSRLCSVHGH